MSTFTTYTIEELLKLQPPTWLIDKILPEQGLIALYGSPGDGKSFIALDMALSIASGLPWQGHAVKKGYVVYISAEGGGGISKRVGAWLLHHQVKKQDYVYLFANFVVSAIRIHSESEDLAGVLADTIDHEDYQGLLLSRTEEEGLPLFIIVDTLARCFQGDENQQEDMGNFIRGLDDLREAYNATILVVHHTGKQGLEERGSSSFRGACDTMMLAMKKDMAITVECTKQKDYEHFPEEALELVVVPEWGSCIVEAISIQQAAEDQRMKANDRDIQAYLVTNSRATVREIADALGLSRSSVHRRVQKMRVGQGFIE